MFSFLCLHFIRPEPCNPTTISLFGHAFLGLDSISYLGSSASCRGESCLLTVQVHGCLDISSVSSSLRRSFLSCTILSPREFCDKKLSSKKNLDASLPSENINSVVSSRFLPLRKVNNTTNTTRNTTITTNNTTTIFGKIPSEKNFFASS